LIKSIIHKIKQNINFQNFLQVQMDEIERKMSKKNIKLQNFEKKYYFTYLYFFKRAYRNFQNSLTKSLILQIKHFKKFHNFLTTLDR